MTDLLPEVPRPPRKMKQPRKDVLRTQLATAEAQIEQQRLVIEHLRLPWWQRLYLSVRGTPKDQK